MLFVAYLYVVENQMFINYFSLEMKLFDYLFVYIKILPYLCSIKLR